MRKHLHVCLIFVFIALASSLNAAVINVSNSTELNSALSSAVSGDVIVLANGTYSGFTISKSGITIQAATKGSATVSSGMIKFNGVSNVLVQGLRITTSGSSQSVDGETYVVGVWFQNANNCRLAGCTLVCSTAEWIMLGGNSNYNRIDHNEFGAKSSDGHYIFVRGNRIGISVPSDRTSWANGNGPYNPNMARNTTIDYNYFHDQSTSTGAALCLGGIGLAGDYQTTSTMVEKNLFVNCDGDAEMIEIKSSGNTVRNNTIRTSVGMISSRAGNNNTITGNLQLQNGKSGSAGIKIYEKNHVVTGNYVDGCADYAFLIGAGDPYSSSSFKHAAGYNCRMDNNIGINLNVRGAIIGHGGSGVDPSGCSFSNNQLRGSANLIVLSHPGNTVMTGNTTSGSNPAMPSTPLTTSQCGPSSYTYSAPVTSEATLYQNYTYGGWSAKFGIGTYTTAQLVAKGAVNNDCSSIKVPSGLRVTLYDGDNFTGTSKVLTADNARLGDLSFNDMLSSMKVEVLKSATTEAKVPGELKLLSAENPVKAFTRFEITVPETGYTKLSVVDLTGKEVVTLLDGTVAAGDRSIDFDASGLPSNMYIVRLMTAKQTKTLKIMVAK